MSSIDVVLGSGNRHKHGELKALFERELRESAVKINLISGAAFKPMPYEIEETGSTYEENALIKARAWVEHTGLPAVSDDSGIELLALGGAPGIKSARAAEGSDEDRVRWLLYMMKDEKDRRARFVACIVLALPGVRAADDYYASTGICDGILAQAPSGSHGFGYDPVFVPKGYDKTIADLGDDIKSKISHRAIACAGMAQMVKSVVQYTLHCGNKDGGAISLW